jgi:hypothetical protein
MAAGDTTIVSFPAGDPVVAKSQIESLSIVSGDIVTSWQKNNLVFVAQIKTA